MENEFDDHRRSSDPVVVTTRDIYDLALQTKSSVDTLLQRDTASAAKQLDHETRLRALEAWRYALPTSLALGLFSSVATVAMVIVEKAGQ